MSHTGWDQCRPVSGGRAPVTAATFIPTPAQQRLTEDLLGLYEERPLANPSWAPELRSWLEAELADHVPRIRKQQRLWVGKSLMSDVLGCEANYQAGRSPFQWSAAAARGEIVHRAVALRVAGSNDEPRDLTWAAIEQAQANGSASLASWLRELPAPDRAALATESLPGIDRFVSTWPAIPASWRPVPEYPVAADFARGRIHVAGRVDLSLGSHRLGADGLLRRRKLLLELKSAGPHYEHRAEHLGYALLETLQSHVAPWRAATYYLHTGTWIADTITLEALQVAARRLVAAVRRSIELHDGRKPTRRAGWRCGSCTLAEGCGERVRSAEVAAPSGGDWSQALRVPSP